jgi:hypothetical protein
VAAAWGFAERREERFLAAQADHFAGAKWKEKASAYSARNDRRGLAGGGTEGGCSRGGARGVGVQAFFVEEEDAGAEGEEHDGEAGGDTETGDDGSRTFVAATDDDVARDGDQELEDAAFQEPGDEAGDESGRISKIEVEENSPDKPEAQAEAPDDAFRGKEGASKLLASDSEAERPDARSSEGGHQESGDRTGDEDVSAGLAHGGKYRAGPAR